MSTYTKVTRHPRTGKWEQATWHDDYFAPHVYGVHFPSDQKVYTVEMVSAKAIKEFWAEDVMTTLRNLDYREDELLNFLNELEAVYKARWKRDPQGGEGAVEHYKQKPLQV